MKLASLVFVLVIAVVFLQWHEVPIRPTDEDRQALQSVLGQKKVPPVNIDEQILLIRRIQKEVITTVQHGAEIPHGHTREPRDVLGERRGTCADRSRVIEKALRLAGFEVRHVALYTDIGGFFRTMMTRKAPSHSLSEVLTLEGWMVVDSNVEWVSLGKDGRPRSIHEVQADVANGTLIREGTLPSTFYMKPFFVIHGLYSRHGGFYPPYDLVPDVNYRELLYNVSAL